MTVGNTLGFGVLDGILAFFFLSKEHEIFLLEAIDFFRVELVRLGACFGFCVL